MSTPDFEDKIGKDGRHKFDIDYLIIIGSVVLLYWYLGLNIEIVDVGMIMAMVWLYWRLTNRYPHALLKPLVVPISISIGLIGRIVAGLIEGLIDWLTIM